MIGNRNIVLIGFMGAGKTTLGKWISQNADMNYIDTDEYIESNQQMTINDIFAQRGEAYFRTLETDTLKELTGSLASTVVSVGGGMPVRSENRLLMKQLGIVVYLRASESELAARLSGDNKRPLLAGTDIKKRIHELMEKRETFYLEAADLVIDTAGKKLDQIYNEIEDYVAACSSMR